MIDHGTTNGPAPPGSAEHTRMVKAHDEAVVRVAKLRRMQSALPAAIADAEERVRVYAARLGLPDVPREKRASPGVTRRRVLEALPGRAKEISERLAIRRSAVDGALRNLHRDGLIEPAGDGTWRRIEADAQPSSNGSKDLESAA